MLLMTSSSLIEAVKVGMIDNKSHQTKEQKDEQSLQLDDVDGYNHLLYGIIRTKHEKNNYQEVKLFIKFTISYKYIRRIFGCGNN